CQQVYTNPLTF
nr:immunoglobulin light chain junction region [Macaca mulatta]MOV92928.1 immunoglobulin light chain junction region [Macaca mulatta]